MTNQTTLDALTEIFRDIFDNDQLVLTPRTTARDIRDWDSLNHANIIVAVESRFRIKFQTAEIDQLKNVGDLLSLIEKKAA